MVTEMAKTSISPRLLLKQLGKCSILLGWRCPLEIQVEGLSRQVDMSAVRDNVRAGDVEL